MDGMSQVMLTIYWIFLTLRPVRPSLVPLTSVKGDLACGVDKSRHLRALEWARFGCEELPM